MPIGVGPYPWSVLPANHWEALYRANAELIDDGIEELPQLKPMALAHLPFDEWFLPFNPSRAVHPYLSVDGDPPWEADRALYPPDDAGPEDASADANADE